MGVPNVLSVAANTSGTPTASRQATASADPLKTLIDKLLGIDTINVEEYKQLLAKLNPDQTTTYFRDLCGYLATLGSMPNQANILNGIQIASEVFIVDPRFQCLNDLRVLIQAKGASPEIDAEGMKQLQDKVRGSLDDVKNPASAVECRDKDLLINLAKAVADPDYFTAEPAESVCVSINYSAMNDTKINAVKDLPNWVTIIRSFLATDPSRASRLVIARLNSNNNQEAATAIVSAIFAYCDGIFFQGIVSKLASGSPVRWAVQIAIDAKKSSVDYAAYKDGHPYPGTTGNSSAKKTRKKPPTNVKATSPSVTEEN